jgi:hypothetical protein
MTLLTLFSVLGMVVSAGIFAALWMVVAVHRINHREPWE